MKRYLIFVLLAGILATSCDKPTCNSFNTACDSPTRAESVIGHSTLKMTREGKNIICELTDYPVNCAFGDVQVTYKEHGKTLSINVDEDLGDIVANCICHINIYFTMLDVKKDEYQLMLRGKNLGTISFKEHDVVMIDLTALF